MKATKGASIFVVDDNEDIREMLSMAVELAGREAYAFADGRAALMALSSDAPLPGLILLDLMMPGMNGREFLRARSLDPRVASIPVLVISGDGHLEEKVAEVGATGYLRKPIELEALLAAVDLYA